MKNIFITIIVIVLVILIGWWFSAKKESVSTDEISALLQDIETTTGIDFSDIKDVDINWSTETGVQIVKGKGFEVLRISDDQFRSIGAFFADQSFEVDVYNVAAGTVSGMSGYAKDKIVCLFFAGVTGYKEAEGQWIPPEPDKIDAEIMCGNKP